MTSTFNLEEVNIPEIVESLTALLFAPVIFPVAAAVKQPVVQTAIKGGITLSERCKEAVAEVVEVFDNITAEVNADLIDTREQFKSKTVSTNLTDGRSEVARDLMNVLSDCNTEFGRMTDGVVDLQLLVPLGLGALAVRQLIEQGIELDEIPWYTLAWYSFDMFIKLNKTGE